MTAGEATNTKDNDLSYATLVFCSQLRLYASDPSATAKVSDTYVGRAIRSSHPILGDDDVTGNVGSGIVPVVYIVPFLLVLIFVFISLIALCLFECGHIKTNKETQKEIQLKNKINNDIRVQGNLAAVSFLCCIFTIYAFILDIKSIVIENNANWPIFYHRMDFLKLLFHLL